MPIDAEHQLLSLVVPVFNEQESLAALFAEIAEVAQSSGTAFELILIDDGSTDDSWNAIRKLAEQDGRVRGIRFRRNFGKAAALQAGFQSARGSVVMTLDADLQDDPHEIPNFLAAIRGGLDVVSGWKKIRLDPWHKTFPSRVFNRMVGWVTGVDLHDHNCGFKAYRAEVLKEVTLYGEMHRFVPVLAAGRGFKVGELAIHHRPRKFGRSKYGWQRFIKGFLDLGTVHFLTRYGRRPQHLLGSYGLVCGLLGFLTLIGSATLLGFGILSGDFGRFFGLLSLGIGTALIVCGSQLFLTGLLSELIVARRLTEQQPYSIAEQTTEKD